MSAAAAAAPSLELPIDFNRTLFNAVVEAVPKALTMCGVKSECVGVSRMPAKQQGEITGMVGAHGSVSGFVAVNMSRRMALHAVSGLVGEEHDELTPQVIDGAGEVTNIITGGVKSALAKTDWGFGQITVPSVIVGDGYQVAFASGLELLEVVFECNNEQAIVASDRVVHVTLSLLKL